jgi:hypothetical protein
MATGIASTYANEILDYFTGQGAPTAIAAFWVKLHTGDPGAAGASNAATETTRKQVTATAASAGATSNSGALTWTSVAASETYSHLSFWDANAAGNFLGSDALNSSQAVTAGGTFEIAAGDLDITLATLAA